MIIQHPFLKKSSFSTIINTSITQRSDSDRHFYVRILNTVSATSTMISGCWWVAAANCCVSASRFTYRRRRVSSFPTLTSGSSRQGPHPTAPYIPRRSCKYVKMFDDTILHKLTIYYRKTFFSLVTLQVFQLLYRLG